MQWNIPSWRIGRPSKGRMTQAIRARATATFYTVLYSTSKGLPRTRALCSSGAEDDRTRQFTIEDLPGPHSNLQSLSLARKFITNGLKLLSTQRNSNDIDPGKILLCAQVRDVKKYGPIFRTKFTGLRPVGNVKVANPADVATVLRSEGHIPVRPDSPVREDYRKKTSKPAGLFFGNGPDWYKHRKLVSKRMLQPKRVAAYEPDFNDIVTKFVTRLEKLRGSHGLEHEVPQLENELFKWSFESVSLLLFDERFGSLDDEIKPEVQEFIDHIGNFLVTSSYIDVLPLWVQKTFPTKMYKQFAESYDKLYHFTEMMIERKLKEFREQDKLSVSSASGERLEFLRFLFMTSEMSMQDLLATYVDIHFAGVDTTSTAILWALYLLAKHPAKQWKLQQEISSVLKPGEIATASSLTRMPYLKACVRETLRLYPVLYLHRIPEQDLVLSGYKIPAGSQVMILVYAMALSELYFADATSFKPERWLRGRKKASSEGNNVDAFASLPFGFGRRMCVGRRVSELEQFLLLTRIVQNYELCYPAGEDVERTIHGITIIPDRPMRVQFVKR